MGRAPRCHAASIAPHLFDSEPAILTFIFGNAPLPDTENIRPISWEAFFAQFILLDLALIYDDSPTCEILHADKPPTYKDRVTGAN